MKNKQMARYVALIAATVFLTAAIILEGCHSKKSEPAGTSADYYTCAMHPQVHEDKPGNCPICGMKLIRVTAPVETHEPPDTALSYLTDPVTETVAGSFKVITPVSAASGDTIAADGTIGFDQRDIHTVASRVNGRIVKSYIKYVNQTIRKGQPLMIIYSPELLNSQRDLLQAIGDKDQPLTGSLKKKLLHLGMSATEIQKVVQSSQPMVNVTLYSPFDGIAQQAGSGGSSEETSPGRSKYMGIGDGHMNSSNTARNVSISSREKDAGLPDIREGSYVNQGQTLLTIRGIHSTWAILHVFAGDIGHIHPGDPVALYAEADGTHSIRGRVDFIPPYRSGDDKTTAIRIYMKSLPRNWKIGALIHGRIAVTDKIGGWDIPLSAVNLLGTHSVVWVEDKRHTGVFHCREVQTGLQTGDSIRVLSGIHPGDQIVENAAYMVDSDGFTD